LIPSAGLFNSEDYKIKDIEYSDKIKYDSLLISLDNNRVLIINSILDADDYIYDLKNRKYSPADSFSRNYKPLKFFHKQADGRIIFFRGNVFNKYNTYLYSPDTNEIVQYSDNLPLISVQLDEEIYADVKYDYFTGYVYNIKEGRKKLF